MAFQQRSKDYHILVKATPNIFDYSSQNLQTVTLTPFEKWALIRYPHQDMFGSGDMDRMSEEYEKETRLCLICNSEKALCLHNNRFATDIGDAS